MMPTQVVKDIRRKYRSLYKVLNEKARRLWVAAEARAMGYGGIGLVARATGISERTIRRGLNQLGAGVALEESSSVRGKGGGRKLIQESDPELVKALEALVDPTSRGDPMSPLQWTCKSTRKLAQELTRQGHPLGERTVARVLAQDLGYSLQCVQKTREGKQHPDRDRQFRYINNRVKKFQAQGQPVISIDCKKKEKIGDFANKGREYRPKGKPEEANVHDFGGQKAIPYGIYDIARNKGWVNVGTDHETAQFAVESIRQWWRHAGKRAYPQANKLLIVADGGGSNGSRTRLWKVELQRLANEQGISIAVSHFPPGTSKWNKIEHRMWNHITENWRGKKLIDHEVVVNLIAGTTTSAGLKIKASLDQRPYPTKIKVTDEEWSQLNLIPERYHGQDWNYTIVRCR